MSLVVSSPYPVCDTSHGWAVVNVRTPHNRTWELVNEELVASAREHAREWKDFADVLSALLDGGWSLQGHGGLYATRAAAADELPGLLEGVVGAGIPVEWCVATEDDGLFAVGGLMAGAPAPEETFPGAPLPALVENDLTGAQRVVETEQELRAAVREELAASAEWWRAHPDQLSDQAAHGIVEQLLAQAEALATEPVPSLVAEKASPHRLFEDAPTTRLAVHPVSAVVFAGLLEATRNFSSLTLAPREGLGAALQARGRALAGELGLTADER